MAAYSHFTRRMQHIVGQASARQCCGASVSEAVWWASMSSPTGNELGISHAVAASNLLCWSCAHWHVASILSNVPLQKPH